MMRVRVQLGRVVLGMALAWTAAGETPRGRASALWLEGLTAYNAKNYEAACPLLAQAAELQPEKGALWADLGMCEVAAGNREKAVSASLRAMRYGDRKARKSALLSLQALGERADIPPDASELRYTCAWLPPRPELDCEQRLWACTYGHGPRDAAAGASGAAVVFGSSEMRILELEGIEPAQMAYRKGAPNQLDLEYEDGCLAQRCGGTSTSWSCEQ
jgi:hypothetical protein